MMKTKESVKKESLKNLMLTGYSGGKSSREIHRVIHLTGVHKWIKEQI